MEQNVHKTGPLQGDLITPKGNLASIRDVLTVLTVLSQGLNLGGEEIIGRKEYEVGNIRARLQSR
jgi:hypothetical protein